MRVLQLLIALFGIAPCATFIISAPVHTQVAHCSAPAVSDVVMLQPIQWAKGRVVATRNIFRKADQKPKRKVNKKRGKDGEVDVSMAPIIDFAGSLLGASASAAAAVTAGAAEAIADVGP